MSSGKGGKKPGMEKTDPKTTPTTTTTKTTAATDTSSDSDTSTKPSADVVQKYVHTWQKKMKGFANDDEAKLAWWNKIGQPGSHIPDYVEEVSNDKALAMYKLYCKDLEDFHGFAPTPMSHATVLTLAPTAVPIEDDPALAVISPFAFDYRGLDVARVKKQFASLCEAGKEEQKLVLCTLFKYMFKMGTKPMSKGIKNLSNSADQKRMYELVLKLQLVENTSSMTDGATLTISRLSYVYKNIASSVLHQIGSDKFCPSLPNIFLPVKFRFPYGCDCQDFQPFYVEGYFFWAMHFNKIIKSKSDPSLTWASSLNDVVSRYVSFHPNDPIGKIYLDAGFKALVSFYERSQLSVPWVSRIQVEIDAFRASGGMSTPFAGATTLPVLPKMSAATGSGAP